jgi:protein TonB
MLALSALVVAPLIFYDRLRPQPVGLHPPVRLGSPSGGSVVTVVGTNTRPKPTTGLVVPGKPPTGVQMSPAAQGQGPEAVNSGPDFCRGSICDPLPLGDPRGILYGIPPLPGETLMPRQSPPVRSQEPVETAQARPPIRTCVGGNVQEGRLIQRVLPDYPPLAIRMRISGVVRLHAIIGTDGRVRELRVMEGHPVLVAAAVQAVRQWLYRPAALNGNPVEVDTEITVRFNLNGM